MKETKTITFEWDIINNNLYEKTYYYVEGQFVRSEITKVYDTRDIEAFDQFFHSFLDIEKN